MKKKKIQKLSLNKNAISNFSYDLKGGAAADSVLNPLSGCASDPICAVVHPPKELSIWSCKTQCWSWFTCP